MEDELNQRVRDALETPPPERAARQKIQQQQAEQHQNGYSSGQSPMQLYNFDNRDIFTTQNWKAIQAKRQMERLMRMNYMQQNNNNIDYMFRDQLSKSNHDEFPGVYGLDNLSEGVRDLNRQTLDKFPSIRQLHRQFYTKEGFLSALRTGKFPDGSKFTVGENGTFVDRFGVIRDGNGPFWPGDVGPLFPTPRFLWFRDHLPVEPLFFHIHSMYNIETELH